MIRICSLLISCFVLVVINSYAKVQCLDENNKKVDWWFVYKLPENAKPKTTGYQYFYVDAKQSKPQLSKPNEGLNKPKGAIFNTLQQIYKAKKTDDLTWAFYNDEPTNGQEQSTGAHAKGAIAVDDESGIWIISSVPKFPAKGHYKYLKPESDFDQSLSCISLKANEFEKVGKQMQFIHPNYYAKNISKQANKRTYLTPLLQSFNKQGLSKKAGLQTQKLKSLDGEEFISIVRSPFLDPKNPDFYEVVATELNGDLLVQTWIRGKATKPACGKHKVLDVKNLKFTIDGQAHAWKNSLGHSKIAYTSDKGKTIVCNGDLNRMTTQEDRGGGTLCFDNAKLHKILSAGDAKHDKCP